MFSGPIPKLATPNAQTFTDETFASFHVASINDGAQLVFGGAGVVVSPLKGFDEIVECEDMRFAHLDSRSLNGEEVSQTRGKVDSQTRAADMWRVASHLTCRFHEAWEDFDATHFDGFKVDGFTRHFELAFTDLLDREVNSFLTVEVSGVARLLSQIANLFPIVHRQHITCERDAPPKHMLLGVVRVGDTNHTRSIKWHSWVHAVEFHILLPLIDDLLPSGFDVRHLRSAGWKVRLLK